MIHSIFDIHASDDYRRGARNITFGLGSVRHKNIVKLDKAGKRRGIAYCGTDGKYSIGSTPPISLACPIRTRCKIQNTVAC